MVAATNDQTGSSTPLPPSQPMGHHHISIAPTLKKLAGPREVANQVPATEIAEIWSRTFNNQISQTQLAALLTLLHCTQRDKDPEVLAECAKAMRAAATPVDMDKLAAVLGKRKRGHGGYRGGLCDLVGTGGDGHSTFNVSTTASIIVSALLAVAKHGNRSQTSLSGSADVLKAMQPKGPILETFTADRVHEAFEESNYCFLLAPNFHPGMKYAAAVRKDLGLRTIFNLMGPLSHPIHPLIEARLIGVAYQQLGPVFADAWKSMGATKSLVVCGQEDLDEISCAGPTNCWWLKQAANPLHLTSQVTQTNGTMTEKESAVTPEIEAFTITPEDFGVPRHPLSEVGGGKLPQENATVLLQILKNEMPPEHPILHFVLINVAALLVVSGFCDSDEPTYGEVIKERGPAGGRWKEGVRLARYCLESGEALRNFVSFTDLTHRS